MHRSIKFVRFETSRVLTTICMMYSLKYSAALASREGQTSFALSKDVARGPTHLLRFLRKQSNHADRGSYEASLVENRCAAAHLVPPSGIGYASFGFALRVFCQEAPD